MYFFRALTPLVLIALLVALGDLWAPSALAHSGMLAGMHATAVTKAHPARAKSAESAAADHAAAQCGKLDLGCCATGASCPAPIAGPPAAALPLPEPGRAAFAPPVERALPASDGERLRKPPRA